MKTGNMLTLAFLGGLFSISANAAMEINITDLPRQGQLKAGLGYTVDSTVEYGDVTITAKSRDGRDRGEFRGFDFEEEGSSLLLSGIYGLSGDGGVFFSVDPKRKEFSVGGYSLLNLSEGYKTLAYARYLKMAGGEIELKFGNATTAEFEKDGTEIRLGLLVLFEQPSGLRLYAGPEFIASSDIEFTPKKKTPIETDLGPQIVEVFEAERKETLGFHLGFSKQLDNSNLSIFGTATFQSEQSYHIGFSKPF